MSTSSSNTSRIGHILTTGLAMFSMFFGAGNIVFPLELGQQMASMAWPAIAGLLLTAVGVPFLGLVAMVLYEGDYKKFFGRLGIWPGFLIVSFIMLLIGPVNAIPRCIALSHGTLQLYIPDLSLFWFSVASCVIIFLSTVRKNGVVDLLGQILSPALVVALAIITIKGLWSHPQAVSSAQDASSAFVFGLIQGYNTMDLLGTFFFSGVIIDGLRQLFPQEKKITVLAGYCLEASVIGAALLAAVYIGFALLASYYSAQLDSVSAEVLLGTLASSVLGSVGGIVVSLAVALACLTTALTLVVVFSEFLQKELFSNSISYEVALVTTLITTVWFANLGFKKIVATIVPILVVGYPVLIVFTVFNILYKWFDVKAVVTPVVVTAVASVWFYQDLLYAWLVG